MHHINFNSDVIEKLLVQAREKQRDSEVVERLEMLLYFSEGASVSETCAKFNISRNTFYRWAKRFNPEDIVTLEDREKVSSFHLCSRCAVSLPSAEMRVQPKRPQWLVLLRNSLVFLTVALLLNAFIILLLLFSSQVQASSWSPTLLVNTESFQVVDEGDSTTNVSLQFGDTLAETITFNRASNRFDISDDINISGNIVASGGLTINADQSGDATITFGSGALEQTITYAAAGNAFEFSTGAVINGTVSGRTLLVSNLQNCNSIDSDGDGVLSCGVDAGNSTGAYISITTDEQATATNAQVDVFEDATYPGTLDFTTNASDNITFTQADGRFTVSETGVYLIVFTLIIESAGNDNTDVLIMENGATIYQHDFLIHSAVDQVERTFTVIRELSGGDYLEFFIDSLVAATDTIHGGTSVSIGILGRNGGEDGGISQADADERYVRTTGGDSMSGTLLVKNLTDTIGIDIDSDATSQAALRIDAGSNSASSPHILFGSGGTYDTNLFRDLADTLRTSDAFKIDGTLTVDGGSVFNEDGTADDFRVESSSDQNAFFVNGTTSQVGVGTATPEAALEVQGSISGASLIVDNLKNCGSIQSNANGTLICVASTSGTIFAEYQETSGATDVNGALIAVPWQAEIREDTGFTHDTVVNNSRVTLDEIGWYIISYSIASRNTSGNNNTVECSVRMNGTTVVDYSTSYSYSSDNTDAEQSNFATFMVETTALNEYYEVVCQGVGTAGVGNTIANESWTTVERPGTGAGGTSSTPILDDAYNVDAGERTIAVDDGSVSWDLTGTHDFIIDLQGTGNVGIDTETPAAPLEVGGKTKTDDIQVDNLSNCTALETDVQGNVNCGVSTGAYISITVDENATASNAQIDIFEDATYPGTLDFTTNASDNIVFTPADGRFTFSVSGTYIIVLSLIIESGGNDNTDVLIMENGATIYQHDFLIHSAVDQVERTFTVIRELSAGDYLEFFSDSLVAATDTIHDGTSVSIGVLGRTGGAGGPITQAEGDDRYVNVTGGDSMSGTLVMKTTTDNISLDIDSEATSQPALRIDSLNGASAPHILFGSGGVYDTNLFRDLADTLRTSDAFKIDGTLTVDGTAIFNEDGGTDNFRVETNGDANTFFIHGTSDQVGVGTSTPEAKLEVQGSVSGSSLVIDNLKNCASIQTNANGTFICVAATSGTVFAEYQETGGATDVNGALVAVPWQNEIREDPGFTHDIVTNNSRVTLDEIGWYIISYSIASLNADGNRNTVQCAVRMNGTTTLNYSVSYSYSRDTTDNQQNNTATVMVETTGANEYYEIMCQGVGTAGVGNTIANQSWTLVERPGDGSGGGGGGGTDTLDAAYSIDSGERTIAVDDGTVSWDLTGTHDFVVDLQGSGNFGIDTDNPSTPLEVVGKTKTTDLQVANVPNCKGLETDNEGNLICNGGTGSYISVSTDENSNGFTGLTDAFADASYPGTLDFTNQANEDITFTATDGRFTIVNTGAYLIIFNVIIDSTSNPGSVTYQIDRNGATAYSSDFGIHSVVDPVERTATLVQTLNAGDYLEFQLNPAVGTSVLHDGTSVNIIRINPTDPIAGSNVTLDNAYDNDTGERTINVDNGDVSFDVTGANNFIVDLQGTGFMGVNTETPETEIEVNGTISGSSIATSGGVSRHGFFYAYDTAGATGLAAGVYTIIDNDQVVVEDSGFYTEVGGVVTIQQDGLYRVNAKCGSTKPLNTREFAQCAIHLNGAIQNNLTCSMYARETTGVSGTSCAINGLINLSNTNTIDLRYNPDATAMDPADNEQSLTLEFVR